MSARHAQIELRITSRPELLAAARALVEAAALRLGFDEPTAGRITLAVDEAMTNVIRHGYAGAQGEPVWVRIDPIDDRGAPAVCFIVEDQCRGVDPAHIQPRPIDALRLGGLGVRIIHEVMDSVEYRRRDTGEGVSLRMVKRLGPPPTQGKS